MIVAGAGPTGLTAALILAEAGVPVTVLEKRATLNTASRACTIHPPTLELLDQLGVLAAVQARGKRADTIQYRTPGGVFAAFDLKLLAGDTPFPYRLHLEQALITPVLVERLSSYHHARVLFGAEVTGVRQCVDTVSVTMRENGTETDVCGAYLVGADGARSQVRESLGIAFDGADYPDKILRLMTQDDLNTLLSGIAPVTYLFNGARSASFLKMPECWRIILRVPKEVNDDEALDETSILGRLREILPSCSRLPTVIGKDIYSVSRRVAGRYRDGRAYLAGDAAHVTNTRGGMNMNCGLHDSAALGHAIARAMSSGNKALIDAASDERRRVANECLIPRTDRTVSGGSAWTEMLRQTAADPGTARAYLRTSAMLDMVSRKNAGA